MPPANKPDKAGLVARLERELERIGAPGRLLVAASGGADSTALLHLLAAGRRRDVIVATVDHGLREGSAQESADVSAWSAALGFPHRILRWMGGAMGPALQERARAARYALLAECAEREGCDAIATAHSADDQAETVFMRLARGSGPAGLRAMSPRSLIAAGAGAPIALLRPLLFARRAVLRSLLEGEGAPFHDDPSNDDPAFERVRTRALLGALEEQGILDVEALCKTALRTQDADRAATSMEAAVFKGAGGWISRFGALTLWADGDHSRAPGLAARLIHAVSGEEHAPDVATADAAFGAAAASGGATLGGALITRQEGAFWVMREPAAVFGREGVPAYPPMTIAPGEAALWDGRFVVSNRGGDPIEVRAFGREGLSRLGQRRALFNVPDGALQTAPDVMVLPHSAVAAYALTDERFFARVRRFPKL